MLICKSGRVREGVFRRVRGRAEVTECIKNPRFTLDNASVLKLIKINETVITIITYLHFFNLLIHNNNSNSAEDEQFAALSLTH